MKLSDQQKEAMFKYNIPQYMHGAIIRYYENHIEPGSFMSAVINNDLKDACVRADETNKHRLHDYMMWFYNEAPSGTWGYPDAVHDWLMKGANDESRRTSTANG